MTVRLEKVRLELEDAFSGRALGAAGAAKTLGNSLDGAGRQSNGFSRNVDQSSASIDRLSGRIGLAVRAVGAFGPALVPVTTALVPVLAGLAGQIGAVTLGAGVMVTAFQGVGDALEAVNKAALEPTAENINAAREAMAQLAPEARKAVRAMQEWRPLLDGIQASAATGFFPGFVDGLERLQVLAPQVESIFGRVGDAAGDIFSDIATGLTSAEGREFITWVEQTAAPTLRVFGETAGNVASGLGDLAMALGPVGGDFNRGLLAASESFASWADGLTATEGYREFIDYVRETGPQVLDTVGSLADAVLQIGEAAAPLGGPILQGIELFADAVAAIADSPLGPPIMAAVTAMSALNLATRAFGATAGMSFKQAATGLAGYTAALRGTQGSVAQMSAMKKGALGVGAVGALGAGLAASNAGLEMQNTLMFAAIGMMAGPWGAAVGGAAGAVVDLATAFDEGGRSAEDWRAAIDAARGDADQLREILGELRDVAATDEDDAKLLSASWWRDKLTDSAGEAAQDALGDAEDAFDEATLSAQEFASANGIAKASVIELSNALKVANELLSGRSGMRQFEAAIDDARKALRENGRTLDINTRKGRENQAALDAIASSALNVVEKLKGTARVRVLQQARRDFIQTAVDMGMPRAEARRLADQLGLLNRTHAKPRVSVEGDAAAELRGIKYQMLDIDGQVSTVTVRTIREFVSVYEGVVRKNHMDRVDATLNPADGGTIPWGGGRPRRAAWGTTVPRDGMPYGDRYPYLLAPGEEVISNRYGQADQWRPLLKAINSNTLTRQGMSYATRDRYTSPVAAASTSGDNSAAITAELRALRRAVVASADRTGAVVGDKVNGAAVRSTKGVGIG